MKRQKQSLNVNNLSSCDAKNTIDSSDGAECLDHIAERGSSRATRKDFEALYQLEELKVTYS